MNRKLTLAALCLLLAAALLTGGAVAALPAELDLRADGDAMPLAVPPSKILADVLGAPLGEAEAAYLDRSTDLTLYLTDRIPHGNVSVKAEEQGVTVTALPFSYTAANRTVVEWVPVEARLGNATHLLLKDGDTYTCLFAGAKQGDSTDLAVAYSARVTLSDEITTRLAGIAYEAGQSASGTMAAYRGVLLQYNTDLGAHLDYLDALASYEAEMDAYRSYLAEKEAFEAAKAAYDAYCTACEEFDLAWDAYTDYLDEEEAYLAAYEAYCTALSQLIADREILGAYLTYLAQVQACDDKLYVMDYIVKNKHKFYRALSGSLVTEVLSRRNELTALGCSAEDIDTAAACTERLRALLATYKTLKTRPEQYAFYRDNYEALKRDFAGLQRTLYSLFDNTVVQSALQKEGKTGRYIQFCAQLYIVRCMLDDGMTLSDDWSISTKLAGQKATYGLAAALDGVSPIPVDGNQFSPADLPYPEECSYTPPEDGGLQDPPSPPTPVRRPTEPVYTPPPGDDPGERDEPTAPTEIPHPGEEPACPIDDPYLLALADAFDAGLLTPRGAQAAHTLTLYTSLARQVSYSDLPLVSFYDHDGKTLLYTDELWPGHTAVYRGETPVRPADAQYSYTFTGWVTAEGEPADLTDIQADCAVYAAYTGTLRSYTVSWSINGQTVTESYLFGAMPVCPAPTDRAPDALYEYTFSGWDGELAPVAGNATYVAQYTASLRRYTVEYIMQGRTERVTCVAGTTPTLPTPEPYVLDEGFLYVFTHWSRAAEPVLSDTSYTAWYSRRACVSEYPTGDVAEAVIENGCVWVRSTASTLDIAPLLELAAAKRLPAALDVGGVRVFIPASAISALRDEELTLLRLRHLPSDEDGVLARFTLALETAIGERPTALPAGITLQYDYTLFDGEYAAFYQAGDGDRTLLPTSLRDGVLTASAGVCGEYLLIERFPIRIGSAAGGAISASGYAAGAGSRVTLTVLPTTGNALSTLRVFRADTGEEIALDANYSFLMPEAGVTVEASFAPARYTVTFLDYDGRVIAATEYAYGDTPVLPMAPVREGYTFGGWTPFVSATVTADLTYTAVYHPTSEGDLTSGNENDRFMTLYLPIIGGVLLAAGLGVGGYFAYRHYRRKQAK